jgi:hypothetical protein
LCKACFSICSGLRDIRISKFVYAQDWILAILKEIVQDCTSSLVQDWIFLYPAIYLDKYFIFPDSEKMAKFKCYNYPTASNNLHDIVHHHVKNHKAFILKVKEKNFGGKIR